MKIKEIRSVRPIQHNLFTQFASQHNSYSPSFTAYHGGRAKRHRARFWQNLSNQRNFLEEFAKKNNIQSAEDWGKVTKHDASKGNRKVMM